MVSGFLLDVTSATLEPASGETKCRNVRAERWQEPGPMMAGRRAESTSPETPCLWTSCCTRCEDSPFPAALRHLASGFCYVDQRHPPRCPGAFSSLCTSSARMGQIRAGRSPLFPSRVPEGPNSSPNRLPFCFTRGPHLPTAPRTRALRLGSEALGSGELGPALVHCAAPGQSAHLSEP